MELTPGLRTVDWRGVARAAFAIVVGVALTCGLTLFLFWLNHQLAVYVSESGLYRDASGQISYSVRQGLILIRPVGGYFGGSNLPGVILHPGTSCAGVFWGTGLAVLTASLMGSSVARRLELANAGFVSLTVLCLMLAVAGGTLSAIPRSPWLWLACLGSLALGAYTAKQVVRVN